MTLQQEFTFCCRRSALQGVDIWVYSDSLLSWFWSACSIAKTLFWTWKIRQCAPLPNKGIRTMWWVLLHCHYYLQGSPATRPMSILYYFSQPLLLGAAVKEEQFRFLIRPLRRRSCFLCFSVWEKLNYVINLYHWRVKLNIQSKTQYPMYR